MEFCKLPTQRISFKRFDFWQTQLSYIKGFQNHTDVLFVFCSFFTSVYSSSISSTPLLCTSSFPHDLQDLIDHQCVQGPQNLWHLNWPLTSCDKHLFPIYLLCSIIDTCIIFAQCGSVRRFVTWWNIWKPPRRKPMIDCWETKGAGSNRFEFSLLLAKFVLFCKIEDC